MVIKRRNRIPIVFPLWSQRITIGRSAENDLHLLDRFTSRVHAEVRREGSQYILQDLGSANGTFHNGKLIESEVPLTSGDCFRIGGTEITFNFEERNLGTHLTATADANSTFGGDVTGGFDTDDDTGQYSADKSHHDLSVNDTSVHPKTGKGVPNAKRIDLLSFITDVGIELLASTQLDDILRQLTSFVLEAVPADRCLILMRDESSGELNVNNVQFHSTVGKTEKLIAIPVLAEQVINTGRAILISDIQQHPQFRDNKNIPLGTISIAIVPLGSRGNMFGAIYVDTVIPDNIFDEEHLKILTTLASVAAIRIENARLLRLEKERALEHLNQELHFAAEFYEIENFFKTAGFVLVPADEPSCFVLNPSTPFWQKKIKSKVYTRSFTGRPLNGKEVLRIYEAAQQFGERASEDMRYAFVIVDKLVEDSAWLQIAALRLTKFSTIPIPLTLILGSNMRERSVPKGIILANHLERFIGQGIDPYDIRDPVSDVLNFFGREALARDLTDQLLLGRAIGLFGLRKMGKSSLMNYMQTLMPYPTARLDLQAGVTLSSVFERVLRLWNNDAQTRFGIDLGLADITFNESDSITKFTKAAQKSLGKLAGHIAEPRLAIFLDEIELITPLPHANESDLSIYLSLMRTFRGLVQESHQVTLMVAGVDASINRILRWGKEQNPFYQLIHEVYLPPLVSSDCIQMIHNIGQQVEVTYDDYAGDYIARASGGHPFLARQLCSLAYKQQRQMAGEMRIKNLYQAAERFILDPQYSVYLSHRGLWNEATSSYLWDNSLSKVNETILLRLATSEDPLPESLITDEMDAYEAHSAIFALNQLNIIHAVDDSAEQDDPRFAIRFGLFKSWIRRALLGLRD